MLNYIRENCVLPAEDKPIYDKENDQYLLIYEEADSPHCPYKLDKDYLEIPFDTVDEANRVYLNTQPEEN